MAADRFAPDQQPFDFVARNVRLFKILLESRPIMVLPPLGEMVTQLFRKTGVIEDQMSARPLGLELELRTRINAFGPINDAPRLNDSLIGNQFHVPADDVTVEQRERAANFAIDLGLHRRERTELLGVQQCLKSTSW
jgi:hypothetical protein